MLKAHLHHKPDTVEECVLQGSWYLGENNTRMEAVHFCPL